MARRTAAPTPRRKRPRARAVCRTPARRKRPSRRGKRWWPRARRRLKRLWPGARRRKRWQRAFRRAPFAAQLSLALAAAVLLWALLNGAFQVLRKPTELFFPIEGTLYKTPTATWRAYGPIFRRHATRVVSADLLAALAQVEASGNPMARTYWRWRWGLDPLEIYRPASSAVGMYQITDGTFAEARRYCIHDHVVVEAGAWHDWRSCWFNALYFRVVPSHAVELTAAYLDRAVASTLAGQRIHGATLRQQQDLAALIHLCGAGAGRRHARAGLGAANLRCGDHDAGVYVARVRAMQQVFARLAAAG